MESYKINLIGSLMNEVNRIQAGGRTNLNLPPEFDTQPLNLISNPLVSIPAIRPQSFQAGVSFDQAMASELSLSLEAQNITQLAHELFDEPVLRSQQVKPLMELHREHPPLWKPALILMASLKDAGADQESLSKALKLVESLAVVVKSHPLVVRAEDSGINLFAKQALQQVSATVALQKSLPAPVRLTPGQVIDFFAQALAERPATFEKEVFSFPVIQSAGVPPKDYLVLSDEVDPLKVALLVIHLKSRKGASNAGEDLAAFVTELKKAIVERKSLKPVFEAWEDKARSNPQAPLTKPYYPTDEAKPNLRFLSHGLNWLSQGKERAVVAQALSPETGVLPDGVWQPLMPSSALLSIQGGLFLTQHLGPGLNRVKFRVTGDEEDTLLDLFLYCVHGLSDEEERGKNENQSQSGEAPQQSFQDNEAQPAPLESPLGGEISLHLVSPFILTRPYGEDEPVKAPLIVKFRFLADLLNPGTLFSRERFLTLKASPLVAKLRESIRALGRDGLKAYDPYLEALNEVFEVIRGCIPQSDEAFVQAQKFLRDEVLLYFMGKKSVVECRPLKFAQKTPKGDVIAGICAVTSDLMRQSRQESDALVEMVDAAHWAQSKPQFLSRIREFFDVLRGRMEGASKPSTTSLALASEFSENVRIL